MKDKPLAFFIIFSFFFIKTIAQNTYQDSIHLQKIGTYINVNTDSAFYYIKTLKKSSDLCKRLEAISRENCIFYRQKKYALVEKNLTELDKKIDSFNNSSKIDCYIDRKKAIYNRLFWVKKNQENYNEAYKYLLKFEKIISTKPKKNQKNFREELTIILNKGVIKNKLNLQEEAIELLKNGYSKENNLNSNPTNNRFFKQWKANILNVLGNTYLSLANKEKNTSFLDSSYQYYQKSYEISKTFEPIHEDSEILYTTKKIQVLIAKKQYQEALELIEKYKEINNGFNYKHLASFQKALCFYNLKNTDSTILNAHKFLDPENKSIERNNLITIYDILSNEYNKIHKIDSAYKYSKLTMQHYALAEKNKEKTFQLLYENDFHKAQQLNQKIKEEESSKQIILIAGFVITITILLGFTFSYIKNKQQKKQLIIDALNDKVSKNETVKKEYNISKELEEEILSAIVKVNTKLQFLDSEFSINTISESIKTNSTYVSFIFNKHYKKSFKQYYTKVRIDHAINKLKQDKTFRKYTIQGIAEEVGYTNASAFTRAFKKQTGVTPSAFLKTLTS